jgi:hypothetical protein
MLKKINGDNNLITYFSSWLLVTSSIPPHNYIVPEGPNNRWMMQCNGS